MNLEEWEEEMLMGRNKTQLNTLLMIPISVKQLLLQNQLILAVC